MFRCLKWSTLVSTVHWLGWVLTDCYSHAEYCYSQVATAWRRSKGYSVLQTSVTESHRVTDCHEPRPVNTLPGWLHWAEQRAHLITRPSYCYCELEPAGASESRQQTSPWWEGTFNMCHQGQVVNVCMSANSLKLYWVLEFHAKAITG